MGWTSLGPTRGWCLYDTGEIVRAWLNGSMSSGVISLAGLVTTGNQASICAHAVTSLKATRIFDARGERQCDDRAHAGYWFTSSTSFANPAITIARSLSDSFAGIAPADVPMFIIAQFGGAAVAAVVGRYLFSKIS